MTVYQSVLITWWSELFDGGASSAGVILFGSCVSVFCFLFFFSSRRRHTISLCDWSSDVCSSDLVPPRARCLDTREKLEIEGPSQRLPRLEHELRGERLDDRRQPAQMVGVAMGCHHHGHPPHTLVTQEGDHHPPPRITLRRPWAAIDHDPAAVGRPEGRGVPLPYIEKMYR